MATRGSSIIQESLRGLHTIIWLGPSSRYSSKQRGPCHYVVAGTLRKKTSFGGPCLFESYGPIFLVNQVPKDVNILTYLVALQHSHLYSATIPEIQVNVFIVLFLLWFNHC